MVSISHVKLYTVPFNLKEPPTAPRLRPHHLQLGSGTVLSLWSLWATLQSGAPHHPGCGNSQKKAKGQTRKDKWRKNELSLNQSQPMVYSQLTEFWTFPECPYLCLRAGLKSMAKELGSCNQEEFVQEKIHLSLIGWINCYRMQKAQPKLNEISTKLCLSGFPEE